LKLIDKNTIWLFRDAEINFVRPVLQMITKTLTKLYGIGGRINIQIRDLAPIFDLSNSPETGARSAGANQIC
jgi:hypothetical protein